MGRTLDPMPHVRAKMQAILTGEAVANRIWPHKAPQSGQAIGNETYVLYSEPEFERIGALAGPPGLSETVARIDVWGTNRDEVTRIANLISLGPNGDDGLDYFSGSVTLSGVAMEFQAIKMDQFGLTDHDKPEHASDTAWYKNSRDYRIWFEEITV